MNEALDMSGRVIGHFEVLGSAGSNGRRAMWFVRCVDCREQFRASGTHLRKMQRGPYRVFCPGCERVNE